MGPKKTLDSASKTINSFMEAEQLMWAKKIEGISKWLNELQQSMGFINEQFKLVIMKTKDMEETMKEN